MNINQEVVPSLGRGILEVEFTDIDKVEKIIVIEKNHDLWRSGNFSHKDFSVVAQRGDTGNALIFDMQEKKFLEIEYHRAANKYSEHPMGERTQKTIEWWATTGDCAMQNRGAIIYKKEDYPQFTNRADFKRFFVP